LSLYSLAHWEMGGGLDRAIDLMSLIFVIGVAVGHALGAKDGENKITRFGDGCVRGGWLGFLVGVSLISRERHCCGYGVRQPYASDGCRIVTTTVWLLL